MNWKLSASAIAAVMSLVACSNPSSNAISNGEIADGIIGGQNVTGSEPFAGQIVAVYNVKLTALCTGSILTNDVVITAAHCVEDETTGAPADPADLRIIFGSDLSQKSIVVEGAIEFQEAPGRAQDANNDLNESDISLIKFAGGLPPGYAPATVLTDTSLIQNGATSTLAGYGIDDGKATSGDTGGAGVLRYVTVTILNAAYSQSEVLFDQTEGKGACHGDSGGPAYMMVNGQPLLYGVTSRGVNDPNNDCSVSAAYTSIPYYASWISSTIQSMEADGNTTVAAASQTPTAQDPGQDQTAPTTKPKRSHKIRSLNWGGQRGRPFFFRFLLELRI
jgi:hypothetical protein